MLKNMVYSALGITSLTTKKIKGVVDELIKSGELSRAEGEKIATAIQEKLKTETKEAEEMVEKMVKKVIDKLNLASKDEINELKAEIEKLKSN